IFAALAWLIDQIRRERLALRTVNAHREESLALVAHTLRQSAEEIQAALPDITSAPLNAAERNALLRLRRQSRNFSRFAEDVSDNDGHARVIVRDRGVGFAKSQIPQIFKKYGRVRTERTRDTVGVGLGLYVVRLIAEAHGGTVSAKSIGLGQGSTFTLSLPLAEAPAEAATGT